MAEEQMQKQRDKEEQEIERYENSKWERGEQEKRNSDCFSFLPFLLFLPFPIIPADQSFKRSRGKKITVAF